MTRAPRLALPADGDLGRLHQRELTERIAELRASILRLRALDVATTEVVRLRCASYHDCYG